MKKGIRGHDIRAKGLSDIAVSAKKYNIEYLQLVLEKSVSDFSVGNFSEKYALSLKKQLGNTKIAVLGSYINPSNPNDCKLKDDILKFKEKIKYASVLKPIAVGTETGIFKKGLTDTEEAYQRVLKTLKELVFEAKKYNVCIGIEGVHLFVINTPQKMKRLLEDLDSDNVRVIFDPVNYLNIDNYKNQNEIINEAFMLFADKICVIHAKDFLVENNEFKCAKPAEGIFNYELLFENMKKHGSDIPVICEEINENEALEAFEKMEKIQNRIGEKK